MKTLGHNITDESLRVLLDYAADAGNWGGTPLVGKYGNVSASDEAARAERGNITQLKKAGLVRTMTERGDTFISFTESGAQVVEANGCKRPEWVVPDR